MRGTADAVRKACEWSEGEARGKRTKGDSDLKPGHPWWHYYKKGIQEMELLEERRLISLNSMTNGSRLHTVPVVLSTEQEGHWDQVISQETLI